MHDPSTAVWLSCKGSMKTSDWRMTPVQTSNLDTYWLLLQQGRVALLGDSAHAMQPNLGQGGCMAIEDGYQLAVDLSEAVERAESSGRALDIEGILKVRGESKLQYLEPAKVPEPVQVRVSCTSVLQKHASCMPLRHQAGHPELHFVVCRATS